MNERHAIVCVDLSFGDTGKGTMIDALAREHRAHTVVRFNGGAQAAHNVVTRDGRHHTFSQFGSATLVPGVETFLSRFMLVHPLAMLAEEEHLQSLGVRDAFARLSVDARALVISPFQQAANRLREMARGANRHGSCGMGIGETMSDALSAPHEALVVGDLRDPGLLRRKLRQVQARKYDELRALCSVLRREPGAAREISWLEDQDWVDEVADIFSSLAARIAIVDEAQARGLFSQAGTLLFEGAQGVLLDEWRGFHPYTTWSTTTFANAQTLLDELGFEGRVTRLGILRSYTTRHGAGPFVTEDSSLRALLPEPHNTTTPWQQHFRSGWQDVVAARYALAASGGADGLAITHVDSLSRLPEWRACLSYQIANTAEPSTKGPAAPLFQVAPSGEAASIVLGPERDLDHQEALSRALFTCSPVYQDWSESRSPRAFCERLAASLSLPLLALSAGPTAEDKTLLGALAASAPR
jgi:adenylosuccinate synthase